MIKQSVMNYENHRLVRVALGSGCTYTANASRPKSYTSPTVHHQVHHLGCYGRGEPGLASVSGIYNSSETPQNQPAGTRTSSATRCTSTPHTTSTLHKPTQPVSPPRLRCNVTSQHKVRFALRASVVTAHAGQPRDAGGHAQPA